MPHSSIKFFVQLFSLIFFSCVLTTSVYAVNKKNHKIAQLEFRDITVGDALRVLSEQSSLNVIASEEATKIKMTMYLKNIAPMDVLEAMAKTYNLWYQKDPKSGVVRVYTVDEFRLGKVDYKNEQTKIYTFKHERNALDFAYIIQDLYGFDRVRLSQGADESEILDDLSERLERFDIIAKNTMNLGGGSSSDFGISGSSSGGSGNSRNNNSSNNSQRNRRTNSSGSGRSRNGAIQAIDPSEVIDSQEILPEVEAKELFSGRFERGNQSMGRLIERLSPIYVTRIKRQNRVLIRTRDQDALKEINTLYKKVDTELATVLMEVKLLQIDLSDGYDSLFDFNIKSNNMRVTNGQTVASALQDATASLLTNAAAAFNPALLASYVSDTFQARLQLLEKENRVTEVATPILLTTNQEVSRVFIGDERPIVNGYEESTASTTATGNSNVINQTIIVPQTEVRNLGTTLLLTPNINADRTVSLRILIEQSTLSPVQATIPVEVGGTLVDADIDVVQTKTFSGTIIARDGSSIAVGGLIEDKAADIESKVPVLGDIPGLGFFFRETSKVRKRTELVVIIRPYITTTPTETARFSREFIERNSLHPNAKDMGNLELYSNNDYRHKGYQLEKPFKEYDLQDKFDRFHDKGDRSRYKKSEPNQPVSKGAPTGKQQTYVELTKYAAKSVRLAAPKREVVPGISPAKLINNRSADLLYDSRVKVVPVASWRKGGVHVTAVALYNLSESTVDIDFKHLKGKWLASSIETAKLTKQGGFGDSTYLYLVSAGSFDDIAKRIKLANK